MIKKEFVRPGATTWGYGWVGRVGRPGIPPNWDHPELWLIDEALDFGRFLTLAEFMGKLPIAWYVVHHPDEKDVIVDALKDPNVVHSECPWK